MFVIAVSFGYQRIEMIQIGYDTDQFPFQIDLVISRFILAVGKDLLTDQRILVFNIRFNRLLF